MEQARIAQLELCDVYLVRFYFSQQLMERGHHFMLRQQKMQQEEPIMGLQK
jgi:hypothetical protein